MRRWSTRAVWRALGLRGAFLPICIVAECDIHYQEPVPSLFSFNSPLGACEICRGFGRIDRCRLRLDRSGRIENIEGRRRPAVADRVLSRMSG